MQDLNKQENVSTPIDVQNLRNIILYMQIIIYLLIDQKIQMKLVILRTRNKESIKR